MITNLHVSSRWRGLRSGPKVAIVGDSITWLTEGGFNSSGFFQYTPALDNALADAYYFAVRHWPGHPIQDLHPLLTSSALLGHAEFTPTHVVMNVGTINMTGSDANWQTHYDAIWNQVSGKTRVVLVTLTETNSIGTAINTYIANKASGNANVRVFDWKAYQDAHPGDTLRFDSVHPTPLGTTVLAAGIRAALDAA